VAEARAEERRGDAGRGEATAGGDAGGDDGRRRRIWAACRRPRLFLAHEMPKSRSVEPTGDGDVAFIPLPPPL
jgi:hypothetical protein